MNNWLDRSGQSWKLTTYPGLRLGSAILMVYGFHGPSPWSGLSLILGLAVGIVSFVLPKLVWCPVCHLHMESNSLARALPDADRFDWLTTLEKCPACGDDGRGTPESRASWEALGLSGEAPYWSVSRMVSAVVITVIFIGLCTLWAMRP